MKKRCFEDGGYTEGEPSYNEDIQPQSVATEPTSFKEAFAAARKAGDKTFTFKGKSYTTELASGKASAPVAGRPRGEGYEAPAKKAPGIMARMREKDAEIMKRFNESRRAADSEMARESRRAVAPALAEKKKVLSTAGLNPNTLLPTSGYKRGGKVSSKQRGDGIASRGKTSFKVY